MPEAAVIHEKGGPAVMHNLTTREALEEAAVGLFEDMVRSTVNHTYPLSHRRRKHTGLCLSAGPRHRPCCCRRPTHRSSGTCA